MTSIRDIAKLAGVSPASVSRILNDDPAFSINPNTRQRVIEIANRLHYTKDNKGPHYAHDALTIGLIVRHDIDAERNDPYFYEIRRGIENEASLWRIRVVKAFCMRDTEKDWQQLKDYSAVIVIGEMTKEATQKVAALNKNVILVDNYAEHSGVDIIRTDFAERTKKILDLLYTYGHRNMAFIGGRSTVVDIDGHAIKQNHEIREASYREWMKLHNLAHLTNVKIGQWGAKNGLKMMDEILQTKENLPTAVIVGSDPMAIGVYKAINNAGLKIPDDISVISFDDVEINQYLVPTLSSVRLEAREMGRTAVELMRNRMIGEHKMPVRIFCSSQLMLRESVKKI